MSVIYILLAISITVATVFLAAFIFSVKNGQYDDAYTPSVRMLFEDEIKSLDNNQNQNKSQSN